MWVWSKKEGHSKTKHFFHGESDAQKLKDLWILYWALWSMVELCSINGATFNTLAKSPVLIMGAGDFPMVHHFSWC